jgi:hypothetical protein
MATFTRMPSPTAPAQQREPLSANVSRFGQGMPLSAGVDYMVHVPPGLSAGVNVNVPAQAFRAWIEKAHPDFALIVSKCASGDVVEVKGHWDDAGKTLNKLGIPSTKIGAGELRDYPLEHAKVLIINCPGAIPRPSFQRIRDFVAGGGYLLTTDWALDYMLDKTFPGYVTWNRKKNKRDMYDAEVMHPDPVLFSYTVRNAQWRLDEDCHLLSVLKPDVVRTLVRSRALAGEDAEGVLAVTFPFGRGHVLHLVGHFGNNPVAFHFGDSLPDPAPVIGISLRQTIAANFVFAGLKGAPIPDR